MRRTFLAMLAASAVDLLLLPRLARADAYPSGPIKLVVPFPAGSATDNIARVLGNELQGDLRQPVVIDNRPGAQGMPGADAVARSPSDGYSLLVAAVSFAATPSMFRKPLFDPVADFVPVSRVATTPLVLVVRADFPVRTPREFITYAKAHPGKLSGGYGSSSSQVCIAQLAALGNIELLPVPYKGIPLAVNDLLAGTVQFAFVDLGNALAQAKGGRLRAIGVTSEKRSPLAPDWPALAEALPGFDIDAWIAVLGPKGLPDAIMRRLHDALGHALSKPDVRTKLAAQGFTPALLGPTESVSFLRSEVQKWSRLSKQAGIEPE